MNPTRSKRGAAMVAVTVVLALGLVLIPAGQASAGGPIGCFAQGTVLTTPAGTGTTGTIYKWTVQGDGTCVGDFKGPYKASFEGTGTSEMLGFCDNLIVRDLNLAVELTLISRLNNQPRTFNEIWTAPITTYPLATPFLVTDAAGSFLGAGALETRVQLKCAPDGRPVAVFNWTQLKS